MTTEVKTTVPGNIWKVLVKVGDVVKKNDDLFIMEVMKTEVHHNSPVDGKVIEVNIVNDQEAVDPGTVAIIIEWKYQFMKDTKSYSQIIQDLSEEIGISKEDTKSLVDVALSSVDIKKINYEDFKEEILTFLVINMFSLICKL